MLGLCTKGEEVVVKCYTNLSQIELILNGKTLVYMIGTKIKTASWLLCLLLREGESHRRRSPSADQRYPAFYRFSMSDVSRSISARKDTPAETLTYVSELTNGRNLYQIAITLLDSNGHRSYQASSMLQVQVVGGRLLGLENGDLADVTEYTANYRRAYHGELIAYVQADSDIPAVVTISGEML